MKDLFKTWLVETPIAHRGLHDKKAPENSLSAFENAIHKGYCIEFDVQMLSDGTIVIFHDDSLSRMTGNDGYIKFLKREDLEFLKITGTDEHIPTLEEGLAFINGRVPVLIEIKNSGKVGELEQNVLKILSKYKGDFAIQSFNPYTLEFFKKHAPNILRGQISGSRRLFKDLSYFRQRAMQKMTIAYKNNLADFISYEADALPCIYVKKFKRLPLLCWAIGSQEEYLRIVKYCDNVIFENFEPRI